MTLPKWITYGPKQGKLLFNTFWQARQKRERKILVLGFVIVIALVLYFLIWAPYIAFQRQLFAQYNQFQSDLPYVIKTFSTYESLKRHNDLPQNVGRISIKSAVSQMLVDEQLVPFGIKVQVDNSKQATLTFKQAPFDLLMTGLEKLSKKGVFVTNAAIKRVNDKGIVSGNIQITFFG